MYAIFVVLDILMYIVPDDDVVQAVSLTLSAVAGFLYLSVIAIYSIIFYQFVTRID